MDDAIFRVAALFNAIATQAKSVIGQAHVDGMSSEEYESWKKVISLCDAVKEHVEKPNEDDVQQDTGETVRV